MAGRGRGRGRGQLSFNMEVVGIGKGENLPPSTLQPTPLFPVGLCSESVAIPLFYIYEHLTEEINSLFCPLWPYNYICPSERWAGVHLFLTCLIRTIFYLLFEVTLDKWWFFIAPHHWTEMIVTLCILGSPWSTNQYPWWWAKKQSTCWPWSRNLGVPWRLCPSTSNLLHQRKVSLPFAWFDYKNVSSRLTGSLGFSFNWQRCSPLDPWLLCCCEVVGLSPGVYRAELYCTDLGCTSNT